MMEDFHIIWIAVIIAVFALAAAIFLALSLRQMLRKAKVYIGEQTNPSAAEKLRKTDKKTQLGSKMNRAMETFFGK